MKLCWKDYEIVRKGLMIVKRNISCLFLVIVLMMNMCVPTFAKDVDKVEVSSTGEIIVPADLIYSIIDSDKEFEAVRNQVTTDLAGLNNVSIEPEICTPVSINSEGLVKYKVSYPNGIINYVTYERDTLDRVILNFYEGEKHDELVFEPNGNLFFNGKKVLLASNNTAFNSETIQNEAAITPRMRNAEYSLSPWGNDSDYSIESGEVKKSSCSWGMATIINATVGAVAALLAAQVSKGTGWAIASSVFTSVASSMIEYFTIYGMEDAYYSYRFDVWEREDSMSIDRYYKYVGYCYSRSNYSGHAFPHTFYEHNYFS